MIRTLIVDDEPLAREAVRVRLERERDLEIVGEVGDGIAAVDAIRTLVPDLVVLDVQMPGLDGFQVLDRIGADTMPVVLFVTAYDRFAIRAFEVHAIDYLLKPFTAERMRQAMARVRRDLERDQAVATREQTAALLDAHSAPHDASGLAHRLTVRHGDAFVMLRVEEIDWIEAAANYVRVHARGQVFVLRGTMSALARRLDPKQFARIHRSTIVNVDRVREIRPEWHGDYDVILADGRTLRLGRSYRDGLLGR